MNFFQVLAKALDPTIKRGIWGIQRGHTRSYSGGDAPHLAICVDVTPRDGEADCVYLTEALYLNPDWHTFPQFLAALKDRCHATTVAVKTEDAGTLADLRRAGYMGVPAYYDKDVRLIVPEGYDAHLVATVMPLTKAATALGFMQKDGGSFLL